MVIQDSTNFSDCGKNVVTMIDSTGSIHIHDKSHISSIKSSNKYLNFKSSSYLSLNKELKIKLEAEKVIKEYGLGSSHIITPYHVEFIKCLENIYGTNHRIQTYQNDVRDILFTSLIRTNDYVLFDEQLNTSFKKILESLAFEKGHLIHFSHNNSHDLLTKLKNIEQNNTSTRNFIITEGVFELQGDICNLSEILKISKQYNCYTILDESNALGVIGKRGYGSFDYHQSQPEVDIIFFPFG